MMSEDLRELADRVEQLEMSNQKLIAELGIIAQKLGVEPSMKLVLDKIQELKATGPITLYRVTEFPDKSSRGPLFSNEAVAQECAKDRNQHVRPVRFVSVAGKLWKYEPEDWADQLREVSNVTAFDSYKAYVETRVKECFTDKQRELLGIK